MQNIKVYDLTSESPDTKPIMEGSLSEIGNSESVGVITAGIDRYKNLLSLNDRQGKEMWQKLYELLGLNIDINTIKKFAGLSVEVRKVIKDTRSDLLPLIDSPEFLVPYTYLLAGFNTESSHYNGKDGVNGIYELSSVIMELAGNDRLRFNGFLCAHRENDAVNEDELSQYVNLAEFNRAVNVLRGISENLGKPYSVEFGHIDGDDIGVNATFPTVFIKYFKSGRLHEMSDMLSRHYEQLDVHTTLDTKGYSRKSGSEILTRDVHIVSVSEHTKLVRQRLKDMYGEDWGKFSKDDLQGVADKTGGISETAYYMTLQNLTRFAETFQRFIQSVDRNDMERLFKLNIENAKANGKEEVVKGAMEMFFDRYSLAGNALYETMFYYVWGEKMKQEGGIGVGFDRGHELYQSTSFGQGYGNKDNEKIHPMMYARRTGKKSGVNVNDLSFRQFWHY